MPTLSFRVDTSPPRAFQELLTQIVWGTPGGLQYRVPHVDLSVVGDRGRWLTAWEGGRLVGGYMLVRHAWGWYRTHLAVAPWAQGRGLGKRLAAEVARRFTDGALMGLIEGSNLRSLRSAQAAGFSPCGQLEASVLIPLSRPDDSAVRRLEERDVARFKTEVRAGRSRGDDLDQSLSPGTGWVLDDGAGPVAGLVACAHLQEITSVGWSPILPLARRLVGRRVLMIHYPWGETEALDRLVRAVMGREGVRVATTLHHSGDRELAERIEGLPRGLGRLVPASPVPIVARGDLPGPLWYTPTFAV